jgi:ribonuclease HI
MFGMVSVGPGDNEEAVGVPIDSMEQETEVKKVVRTVTIYTDGAAEPNPGPGGYGVVLLAGKHRKELSGGFRRTTNNRMELLAVIVGLEALTQACVVTIYSDSKYVVESVERGSVIKWSRNQWMRTKTERAKNADLWERFLDAYSKHQVKFKWVKGHAGIPENERCDELAVEAAQSGESQVDVGYMRELGIDPNVGLADAEPDTSRPFAIVPNQKAAKSDIVHKEAGEPCRKCGTPLERKKTKPKQHKPEQSYYFEWYLKCPGCNTMYMVEDAKRSC